jgi:MFS family permease
LGTFEDKNKQERDSVKVPASAWRVLAVLSSIATMVMYAETMLIPALPDLIHEFNVSYSISSWILTAYLIPGAVMTPIAGKLSDIYGKKKVLLIIMAIYIAGLAMAAVSSSIYMLIISRAIQGIGMAMFVIAFGIIRDQFPREKISIGQGVITSMFASGAVIGLLAGGIIINNYGWHATFLSTIPIAIALFFIIWRFDHEAKRPPQQQAEAATKPPAYIPAVSKSVDVKGALTLATFVTSFLIALTLIETGSSGGMAQIALFLAIGAVALTLFIVIERRTKSPLVDFKLIGHKAIMPSNLIIMVVGFSMFMVFQTVPVLVRNPQPLGFGGDAATAGYVQLPFALVLLVFGPTSGFIVSKLGSLRPIIIGTAITAAGFLALLAFHQSWMAVAINLAVLSTGLSLTNVGAMNVTILATPPQFTGMSLGMSNLLRIIGSSVGPALAGVYMQMYQSTVEVAGKQTAFPSMQAYSIIFLTAAVLSIASIGLAVYLRKRLGKMSIPNLA